MAELPKFFCPKDFFDLFWGGVPGTPLPPRVGVDPLGRQRGGVPPESRWHPPTESHDKTKQNSARGGEVKFGKQVAD